LPLATFGLVFLAIPLMKNYLLENNSTTDVWKSAKLALLFYIFVSYVVVGVLNFPFTFLYAVYTVPFYCFVSPSGKLVRKLILLVWWVMTSPIIALASFSSFATNEEFWNSIESTGCSSLDRYPHVLRGILMIQASYLKYQTFIFPFLCFVHVPLHIVALWIILSKLGSAKIKNE